MATKKSKKTKSQDKVQAGKRYKSTKTGKIFDVIRIDGSGKHCQIQDEKGARDVVKTSLINNHLIKSKIVEVKKVICERCEVNPAEIKLINGQETELLCSGCGQETLYDMAITNNSLNITNKSIIKPNGLITLEVR